MIKLYGIIEINVVANTFVLSIFGEWGWPTSLGASCSFDVENRPVSVSPMRWPGWHSLVQINKIICQKLELDGCGLDVVAKGFQPMLCVRRVGVVVGVFAIKILVEHYYHSSFVFIRLGWTYFSTSFFLSIPFWPARPHSAGLLRTNKKTRPEKLFGVVRLSKWCRK